MQKQKKVIAWIAISMSLVLSILIIWPNIMWYFLSFFFSEWSEGAIRFSVESSADDRPIIVFKQGTIDYRRNPFFIIQIYELVPSKPEKFRPVWSIQEKDGPTKNKLLSLTYGLCPPGFYQNAQAERLLKGHYYQFISDVVRKNGPHQYEVISYKQYREGVRAGLYKDAME